MSLRILHLLDPTTPGDALDVLALLLANGGTTTHRIVALGHHSTADLATLAGIPANVMTFLHSAGWADPTGWRAVKKIIRQFQPTHVHAWGAPAAIALAASRFAGPRLATFTDNLAPRHLQILRVIERRCTKNPFTWTAFSPAILRQLTYKDINPRHTKLLPTCIPLAPPVSPSDKATLRATLGLARHDGPILLLGGEGPNARYDLGFWTAGIMQHLYPTIRCIAREDARHRGSLAFDRFLHNMVDDNMITLAPADLPWKALVPAADILLVCAEVPVPAASLLAAIAAGVPIVSVPNPLVADLLRHDHSALFAQAAAPRPITHQLETLIAHPALRQKLAAQARQDIPSSPAPMIDAILSLYAGNASVSPKLLAEARS